jgi:hypothetical protein
MRLIGLVLTLVLVLAPRPPPRHSRWRRSATELVRMKVDVIVVGTDLAVAAIKRQTRSVSIVMGELLDSVTTFVIESLTQGHCRHRLQATPWL